MIVTLIPIMALSLLVETDTNDNNCDLQLGIIITIINNIINIVIVIIIIIVRYDYSILLR